jgi:hypothetical protein
MHPLADRGMIRRDDLDKMVRTYIFTRKIMWSGARELA